MALSKLKIWQLSESRETFFSSVWVLTGHHLIKIIASCLSLWEHLLRTLWNSVDTELPFISQVMGKRDKAGISSLLFDGSRKEQRRLYVLFRHRCI
jgi:hypothetical protein